MNDELAHIVASHIESFRRGFGVQIVWNGASYAARIVQPQRRQFEFLADGLGINAASGDVRDVMLSPGDFTGGVSPHEGDVVTLDTDSGHTFQVLRCWIRSTLRASLHSSTAR